MNFHNITVDDMLNGEGLRVVLWVAGCNHYCDGCQNPITWDPCGGIPFALPDELELYSKLSKDYISGLTFSGGDPLYPGNRKEVFRIARYVKQTFLDKTIWLYTGFTWEQIKDLPDLKYIDVLVDGQFMKELADINYHWAGSTNQRIIDVQKSLVTGEAVLYSER